MALSPSQQSRSSATLPSVANLKHGVDFEAMYNRAVALVSKRDYSAALFLLRPQETQPEVEHNPAVQNIMAAAYRGAAHQLAKRPRPDSVYFERPPQGDMSSIALHSDYLALLSGAIQAGASELNSFRNQNTRAQHVGYYAGASLASFDLHIAPTLTEADRQHMSQPSVRHAYASDRGEAMVQYIEKRAIKQLDHDIDTAMNYIASIGQSAAQLATKKNWFAQSTKLLTKTPERTFVNSTAAINRQNSKQHVPAADFWKQWVQREQLKFSHSLEMELAVDFATFGS